MNLSLSAAAKISDRQKAAILLVALGEKLGIEVLKHLNHAEVKAVSEAIASLKHVDPNETKSVLEEFCMAVSGSTVGGGADSAKRLLVSAFGPLAAQQIAQHLPRTVNPSAGSLQRMDQQQLSRFLDAEQPQTIALILSQVPAERAAAFLANLDPVVRSEVILRIARLDRMSDVAPTASGFISEKVKSLGEMRAEPPGGPRAAAEILNRMESDASDGILESMSKAQQSLADVIRNFMFSFEDIVLLDINAVKEVVAKVDRKLLTVALKGSSEPLRNHFRQCMSQEDGKVLKEDVEATGPVTIRDVETAQKQVLAEVQQLESEGAAGLRACAGGQYV